VVFALNNACKNGVLFRPSRKSGNDLRNNFNASFADALLHLSEACKGHVVVPSDKIAAVGERIGRGSRESPYLFSLYFQLVDAIEQDRLEDVEAYLRKISDLAPADDSILITSLRPDDFPWDAETVAQYFSAEADSPIRYLAPSSEVLPKRKFQISAALDLIRDSSPALASEIDELVTTVIIAGAGEADSSFAGEAPVAFQGSSALRAFGAILQDAQLDADIIDCAASLIHEEAHNVLFAVSPMEGVVENPDEQRFASPLRDDPRPLEGIFHATFVLARMVYGMREMIASGKLTPAQMQTAEAMKRESIPLFFDGLETVHQHGVLTPQGAWVLSETEEYMAAFK
jgi:hypothetical protein